MAGKDVGGDQSAYIRFMFVCCLSTAAAWRVSQVKPSYTSIKLHFTDISGNLAGNYTVEKVGHKYCSQKEPKYVSKGDFNFSRLDDDIEIGNLKFLTKYRINVTTAGSTQTFSRTIASDTKKNPDPRNIRVTDSRADQLTFAWDYNCSDFTTDFSSYEFSLGDKHRVSSTEHHIRNITWKGRNGLSPLTSYLFTIRIRAMSRGETRETVKSAWGCTAPPDGTGVETMRLDKVGNTTATLTWTKPTGGHLEMECGGDNIKREIRENSIELHELKENTKYSCKSYIRKELDSGQWKRNVTCGNQNIVNFTTTATRKPSTTGSAELTTTDSTELRATGNTELKGTGNTEPRTTGNTELRATGNTDVSATDSAELTRKTTSSNTNTTMKVVRDNPAGTTRTLIVVAAVAIATVLLVGAGICCVCRKRHHQANSSSNDAGQMERTNMNDSGETEGNGGVTKVEPEENSSDEVGGFNVNPNKSNNCSELAKVQHGQTTRPHVSKQEGNEIRIVNDKQHGFLAHMRACKTGDGERFESE